MSHKHKLLVARPTGYSMECSSMGTYLFTLGYALRSYPDIEPSVFEVGNPRISMMRNLCSKHLRDIGATHLYFLDPDMWIDAYTRNEGGKFVGDAKPFFDSAWHFLQRHNAVLGSAVVAAPYCGRGPEFPVHVFCNNKQGNVVRLTRQKAATLRGWHRVAAVGTGAMLMDAGVLAKLDHPHFHDTYTDITETKLANSQDVYFCMRCRAAGIPIYVNFDCWAKHWQNWSVPKPGDESAPPREEPLSMAGDASVPELVEDGAGDLTWK